MLQTLAIYGYRSIRDLRISLGSLNLVTGSNGSGKSSLYRALRLLASISEGALIRSLASEGGLQSTLWAGPERISREMLIGAIPIQGTKRSKPVSLRLGFSSDEFTYAVDLGLPVPSLSMFHLDPVIKREWVWQGMEMQPKKLCADRKGPQLRCRTANGNWHVVELSLGSYRSLITEYCDPNHAPEIVSLRESIRRWRFYDHFRADCDAPARKPQVATLTPCLSSDGSDVAAALQTILEIGDSEALRHTIEAAFPGSRLEIGAVGGRMQVQLQQPGMLRPLTAAELSDGTLRFLQLVAALLTPRPPELMVLNEPETSLHPELLPALANLISHFADRNQLLVITHAPGLISELTQRENCSHFSLIKTLGETVIEGASLLDRPNWVWPKR